MIIISSFIIDKREFVKIAGLLAGLQNADANDSSRSIYWWNPEEMKLHDDDSFMELMATCWKCNALSVIKQYNDPVSSLSDYTMSEAEKRKIFKEYKTIGRNLIDNIYPSSDLKKYFYALVKFTSSFNYQTEDEELNRTGMAILQEAIYHISKRAFYKEYDESEAWGEFTVESTEATWDTDLWNAYTN